MLPLIPVLILLLFGAHPQGDVPSNQLFGESIHAQFLRAATDSEASVHALVHLLRSSAERKPVVSTNPEAPTQTLARSVHDEPQLRLTDGSTSSDRTRDGPVASR